MGSSDGELELHPHEDFDEAPSVKKVVHKVTDGQENTRPTMKVHPSSRKRSPILATANGIKKVAEVKPVVSTKAAAPAKQLAGATLPDWPPSRPQKLPKPPPNRRHPM